MLKAGDAAAQGPQAGGIATLFPVDVDPKAGHAFEPVGAVQLPVLLQLLALVVVEQAEDQAVAAFLGQRRFMHGLQGTTEAAIRRQSGGQVQIAAPFLHQLLHQGFDLQLHGSLWCPYLCSVPLGVRQ